MLALYSLVLAHFVTRLGSKVPRRMGSVVPRSVVPRQMLPSKRSFEVGMVVAVWTWPADLAWFLIGIVGTVVAGRHLHNTLAGLRLGGVN